MSLKCPWENIYILTSKVSYHAKFFRYNSLMGQLIMLANLGTKSNLHEPNDIMCDNVETLRHARLDEENAIKMELTRY